jgi:excinuclease ABC subunit C
MIRIEEKLESLHTQPGAYLMRDQGGKVIYVGKAKDLRARVRAYFHGGDERFQIRFLMRKVADVETLVTRNEKEALILENNLIKQYRPRYNIRLKDDKSYLSIKVTVQHPWPRILRNRARPCLQWQIKRCLGPCVLPVDAAEYQEHLRQAILFVEGKSRELLDELRKRMKEKAEALEFESAAKIRDQIQAVEKTLEKQRMVSHWGTDQDIFGIYREGGFIEVQILFVRQGKLTANQAYSLAGFEFPDEEILESLLTQFYQGQRFIPDEVMLPVELDDREVREDFLSERKGKRVSLLHPQRGDRRQLVEMAAQNARQSFFERHDQEKERERMLLELQETLRLKHYPQRIECFDISNIQGTHAVGSMVTFFDGEPDKKRYRHYRIRTVDAVSGGDDFAMMHEVLRRRFRRGVEEGDLSDLVVVDGGKGQLGVALAAMHDLGLSDVDVVALAKMRVQPSVRSSEIERTEERVFVPGRSNPVNLRRNSNALFLLQRVRDEAHRFAITHHKKLRARHSLHSGLDGIPGIGGVRKRDLLRAFGNIKQIQEASVEELLKVPTINENVAHRILEFLRSVH